MDAVWVHNECDPALQNKIDAEMARKVQEDKGRFPNMSRDDVIRFIKNIRSNGTSYTANNGKKLTLSQDKKWGDVLKSMLPIF